MFNGLIMTLKNRSIRTYGLILLLAIFCYSCSSDNSVDRDDNMGSINDDDEVIVEDPPGDDEPGSDEDPPQNSAPASFGLLSFFNGEEEIDLVNPEFSWENSIDPDGDPVTYTLLLDPGEDPPIAILAEGLTQNTYTYETRLERNRVYSWQVIASDSNGATTSSDIFTFRSRPLLVTEIVNDAEFEGREEHTSVFFDNRIWILGGVDTFERADDIWSSIDGLTWVKETNNAGFISRGDHASVVFDNKMWIIGGIDNIGVPLKDIWSSTDGINWTLENMQPPFTARYNHSLVVYNNKIWLIGGQDRNIEFNDVWSSEDGVNWILETADAGFPTRQGHSTVVFNDKIYLIGGINSNQGSGFGPLNDVWSSEDGINWEVETIDAEFSPRSSHSAVVLDNEIWVIAGLGNGRINDIWSSKDGINWTQEAPVPNQSIFSSRFSQTAVIKDGIIFMIGGNDGGRQNEVWTFEN